MSKIKKEIDNKNSEIKITVPVETSLWKQEQEKAFKELAKKTKVAGFRAGKAPMHELKKHISSVAVWEKAISKLLNVVVKEAAKEIKETDIVLDSPTYAVEKVSDEELEIIFIYPIFPELKIKDFKNTKVKFNTPTKTEIDEDVEKQINKMLSRGALLIPKEGKNAVVADGDTIVFDFKGFMDGEAFEGGEAEAYELEIGSNSFIKGFEEQLIGKKAGWEGDIKVVFPTDYYKEDFRDKEAKFEIKIHEIKAMDKQEMNDEFVKTLSIPNVNNEKELKEYLTSLSQREMNEKSRSKFVEELFAKIIEENEIPTPRTVVLKELQALLKKFEENLKSQGISKKEYFALTGYNEEKVKEELMVEAEKSVKKSMLFTFYSKDLKIKATEEDIERQYQRIAKLYQMDSEMIKQMIKPEIIEPQIINELVIDQLIVGLNPSVKIEKEKVEIKKPKAEKKDSEDKKEKESKKKE